MDASNVDSADLATLKTIGAFFVFACPESLLGEDVDRRLPAHRLVIEPLVARTNEMRIYGSHPESGLWDELLRLGARKRNYVQVDLSREVVKGHERIWNSGAWERGAIVLATTMSEEEIGNVFQWCSGPAVWSSHHQMNKSTPLSATKHARSAAAGGSTAFCFSASNGIEIVNVFAPEATLVRLFAMAHERCRAFKRYVEHNPGEDEIIVDRPPYVDMV